jgi:hypothetical protein
MDPGLATMLWGGIEYEYHIDPRFPTVRALIHTCNIHVDGCNIDPNPTDLFVLFCFENIKIWHDIIDSSCLCRQVNVESRSDPRETPII